MGKWKDLYDKWVLALASKNTDTFFLRLTKNDKGLETEYNRLGDIEKFTMWLKSMADSETSNIPQGSTMFMTIGNDRKCFL